MADKLENLKPFEKGEDERRNRGAPKKEFSISKIMREMSQAEFIDFSLTITDKEGQTKTQSGSFGSKGSNIAHLAVAMFMKKVVQGDLNAFKIYLERTEGKEIQKVEVKDTSENPSWDIELV